MIGFGTGMSTATLLANPGVERVDTIEIEPAMVEGARHFRPFTDANYEDPRSRIIFDDAKSYFARSGRKYDIIVSEPSNPWVTGVSSLFTREFYARVRGQLNAGGVLVQWIHTYSFNDGAARLGAEGPAVAVRRLRDLRDRRRRPGDRRDRGGRVPRAAPRRPDFGAMGAALRGVGVGSVDDFSRLAVARGTTADLLVAASTAPVNSDYFPFVDLNAARARFMHSSSDEIRSLRHAPVPLLDLVEQNPTAQAAVDAATGCGADRGAGALRPTRSGRRRTPPGCPPARRRRPRPATTRISRRSARSSAIRDAAATTRRRAVGPHRGARGGDHPAAAGAGGGSDVAAAGRRCVREPGCRSASAGVLVLFVATAARDAPAMRRAAEPLLGDDGNTPAQWQYVIAAAGAGAMAMKDGSAVGRLLRDYGPRLPPQARQTGWFALLSAVSGQPVPETPR